jgi:hypothetical protein
MLGIRALPSGRFSTEANSDECDVHRCRLPPFIELCGSILPPHTRVDLRHESAFASTTQDIFYAANRIKNAGHLWLDP